LKNIGEWLELGNDKVGLSGDDCGDRIAKDQMESAGGF